MRPYYDHAGITIYHGDYAEVLPEIRPLVDAICTDPPYGETSLAWDRWQSGWPSIALKCLIPTGSMWCFGSMRMFLQNVAEFGGWQFAQDIVWEKHNGSSFHADRFKRVHEHALHFYPKSSVWGEIYSQPQFTMDATKRTSRRKQRPAHT